MATTIEAAEQFIAMARHALATGHHRALIDNLYSAVELLAKASLLSCPDRAVLNSKTHKTIAARLNRWSKMGNADKDHSGLLNKLKDMRDRARYGLDVWQLPDDDATQLLARAEAMLAAVKEGAPRRATR